MSQRMVSIHAYDCMDNVVFSCRVREYNDYEKDEFETVASIAGEFPGVGHPYWPHWLADVLTELLDQM